MPDPLDGNTLVEDAAEVSNLISQDDFIEIDESLDLSGLDDSPGDDAYSPNIGERVKVEWTDGFSGEDYEGYGIVKDLTAFETAIVELERDVDGIRSGTLIESNRVEPIEPVRQVSYVENQPELPEPTPVMTEKLPAQAPMSIQELQFDNPPSYVPKKTSTLRSIGGSSGGGRLRSGQISSSIN